MSVTDRKEDRCRAESHMKMKADIGVIVHKSKNTKDFQHHEARRDTEWIPHQNFQKEPIVLILDFWFPKP